ncbi:MAG TPA: Bax inhibitor-1 family protein [Planctomycetota bacterium]|nr:Bax inhibitor-1 family protein [Planctomycetota bacterium]
MNDPRYDMSDVAIAGPSAESRARFIMRTYGHLLGAIFSFVGLEIFLFKSGMAESIFVALMGVPWLVVLGAFMIIGWLASRVAHTVESLPAQYAALAVYVVIEAIIFVPMLVFAEAQSMEMTGGSAGGVIGSAALVTAIGFTGLSGVVYVTRKDFSFLRGILWWAFVVSVLAIVGGALFGFQLGTFFSVAMIALAGGAVLYDTSNILHHYPEDRYVGASLELFASIALMFWYVLRLFLSRD